MNSTHTPVLPHRGRRLLALLGAAALGLTGCSAGETAPAADADCTPVDEGLTTFTEGVLTVGVPQNPPYTTLNGTEASGFEIDIVEKLAAAECLTVSYVPITYANGIAMINNQRQTDLITGGWYVTPERAAQVGFTTPITYDELAIISTEGIDTVTGLETAGLVGSGTGFSWQDELTQILGDRLRLYPGTTEIKQDLEAGRIQVALDGYAVAVYAYRDTDYTVAAAQQDERVAITIDKPLSAFPIDRENQALSDAFSALIDQYREDGTLAAILTEHELSDALIVPADVAATSLR